jgi:tetratricopeptide (TPR) repeat protein
VSQASLPADTGTSQATLETEFAQLRALVFARSADAFTHAGALRDRLAYFATRAQLVSALASPNLQAPDAKSRVQEAADQLRQLEPKDSEAVLDLAIAYLLIGQRQEAVAQLVQAMGGKDAGGFEPGVVVSLLELLFRTGRTTEAEEVARSVLGDLFLPQTDASAPPWVRVFAVAPAARRRLLEELLGLLGRLLRDAPHDRALLRLRAATLCELGQPQQGLAVVEPALAEHPDDAAARWVAAVALARLGRPREALDHLGRLPDSERSRPEVLAARVRLLASAGGSDEAIRTADRALTAHPDDVGLRVSHAMALAAAGRHDDSLSELDELLAANGDRTDLLTLRGTLLQQLGRPADAVESLQRAVDRNPQDVQALTALGQALADLGSIDEGLAVLDRAVLLTSDPGEVLVRRARILHKQGRNVEALEVTDQAVEHGRSDHATFALHGDILRALQRSEEAATWYQKAFERARSAGAAEETQQYAGALGDLAREFADAGQNNLALRLLDQLHEAGELRQRGMGLRAELLRMGGRFREAVEQADAALADGVGEVVVTGTKAAALIALSRSQDGLELLEAILAKSPDYPFGWHAKIIALDELGRVSEGLDVLNQNFREDATPSGWRVWTVMARSQLLLDLGRYPDAVEVLEAALADEEEVGNWLSPLGIAYSRLHRIEDAIKALRRAIQLSGDGVSMWSLNELGDLLVLREGRLSQEAAALYGQVIGRPLADPTPRDGADQAWARLRLGSARDAVAGYRSAFAGAVDPLLTERFRLAFALYAAGATGEAENELAQATERTSALPDQARSAGILAEARHALRLLAGEHPSGSWGTAAEAIETLGARLGPSVPLIRSWKE